MSIVDDAMNYARGAHQGQFRDDGKEYITHPEAVVNILKEHGITDENILAAAWLHDVVEDTKLTLDDIEKQFNWDVRANVDICTRAKSKLDTIVKLARLAEYNGTVIKLADRFHNLSDMKGWDSERKYQYAAHTLGILYAIHRWKCAPLWDKLATLALSIIQSGWPQYDGEDKQVPSPSERPALFDAHPDD